MAPLQSPLSSEDLDELEEVDNWVQMCADFEQEEQDHIIALALRYVVALGSSPALSPSDPVPTQPFLSVFPQVCGQGQSPAGDGSRYARLSQGQQQEEHVCWVLTPFRMSGSSSHHGSSRKKLLLG
jgi:hypothetical protein